MQYGIKVLMPGSPKATWLIDKKYNFTSMYGTEVLYVSDDINEAHRECQNRSDRWSPTYKYHVEEMNNE